MSSEADDLNLSIYQSFLLEDQKGDPYKIADVQRQCIAQIFKASCNSLNNNDTCNLLDSKLTEYSENVCVNGKSIYQTRLDNLLNNVDRPSPCFKSNLDHINVADLMKSLSCSTKNKCDISESPSSCEFDDLLEVLNIRKPIARTFSSHSSNTRDRQQYRNDKNPESRFVEKDKESSNRKENSFRSARDELHAQNLKKYGNSSGQQNNSSGSALVQKRKLGTRRSINSKFVSPLLSNNDSNEEIKSEEWSSDVDERLKNIDPKMVELIKSEIMDCGPNIHWNDIAGLSFAKTAIQEAVVWPMLRPDIFTGLRRPPKGILLFGPPGTGKTLIGKCVASQSKSTFFSISASSLTSKWIGDGEKMVRALFTVARVHQPAVIFIDEIDSLLSQRSDTEHESSRRIKTEFLVQLDGATTDSDERILVIGATNRPQELDEAARRRFVKRLYIPLPEFEARQQLVERLISKESNQLSKENFKEIASLSEGYSGADIRNLCSEASLGPIRSIDMALIEHIEATEVRPLLMEDFEKAFNRVKSSVSPKDLEQYTTWNRTYGSSGGS